jgi:hypothetical protein
LLVACWFIAHAEPLRFVVVSTEIVIDHIKLCLTGIVALHWSNVITLQCLGYCMSSLIFSVNAY